MKKLILCVAIVLTMIPISAHAEPQKTIRLPQLESIPPYAKWGVFAMTQVRNKYKVEIVDYLHVGRKILSPNVTQETFKFWVRGANQLEYGIFVVIKFETKTEKVLSIDFIKTNH